MQNSTKMLTIIVSLILSGIPTLLELSLFAELQKRCCCQANILVLFEPLNEAYLSILMYIFTADVFIESVDKLLLGAVGLPFAVTLKVLVKHLTTTSA